MSANFTPEQPSFKTICYMNMQRLTNFPFIEADFDALTNYELLCKIVEYLNEVISNNNEQNETITGLYNAYVDLQDYVNNYFESLDVQEEINNKLDNMAQDGTLTQLISDYLDPYVEAQNLVIQNFKDEINGEIEVIDSKVTNAVGVTPIAVADVSDMTDTTKLYVNTTDGKWYYYDGDSWEIGGTYQSTGIGDGEVVPTMTTFMVNLDLIPDTGWHYNKLLNYSTGIEQTFEGGSYSDVYIEIPTGVEKIIAISNTNGGLHYYYYDNSKDFVSTGSSNNREIVSIPNDIKYIRIGFQNQLGAGTYKILFYNEFIQGVNLENAGKLKDEYVNLDSKTILYNTKKLNILPYGYNAITTHDGNIATITATTTGYAGFPVTWNVKKNDVVTIEFSGDISFTYVAMYATNQNNLDISLSSQIVAVSLVNNKAEFTITDSVLESIKHNSVWFTFAVTNADVINAKISLNNDFYYFSDLVEHYGVIKNNYKALFLGDSITALTGNRGWWTYFNDIINVTEYQNVAVSGAHLTDYENTVYDGNPNPSAQTNNVLGNQVQKVINNSSTYITPDFILIAIGTNDGIVTNLNDAYSTYYNSDGSIKDLSSVNRKTSAGAFRYCNEKLHELYPNAMIVWCTPIQAVNTIRNVKNIISWGDNLKLLCSIGSNYCIDSEKCGICGINEISGENGEDLADGLHPNSHGAEKLGSYNACEFKKFLDRIN